MLPFKVFRGGDKMNWPIKIPRTKERITNYFFTFLKDTHDACLVGCLVWHVIMVK